MVSGFPEARVRPQVRGGGHGRALRGRVPGGPWPVTVYPFALRLILTFLVPLAVAITVPAQGITSRLTGQTLAMAAAFTAALVGATRWFWKRGLRRYSGVGLRGDGLVACRSRAIPWTAYG